MKKNDSLIGKRILMCNGQYANCVLYRNSSSIDVQFDDGVIVRTSKRSFLNGIVKKPKKWVGKINKMHNGQMATIVAYRGYYDIDVQFEDGTIVTNKAIGKFTDGSIANPKFNSSTQASCFNMEIIQNNGQKARCIAYHSNVNIDVQFEDGTIVKHKQKRAFLKGGIRNPNFNEYSIEGMIIRQNCGMNAACIVDRRGTDIDVQFEDGTIVRHRDRYEFFKGLIKNHNIFSCLNLTIDMHNGQKATCICYRDSNDIDVQFEDGTIVKHIRKDSFIRGWLQNPNFNQYSCINKTLAMLNGQKATCIAYRKSYDIDIRFEDGTVVTNKTKASFERGEISNPNFNPYSCLNETRLMNNGMEATCIEYRTCEDIDIRFKDGTIVKHKNKSCFMNGSIANPNILNGSLPEHVVYYFIKKHFKNAEHNYRPDWLKNPLTKSNLEIDIWIPELKIGVEYDGVKWHSEETQKSQQKAILISKSNQINKIYTILEKGCIIHNSPKHINYLMESTSNSFELPGLYKELTNAITNLLSELGINEHIDLDNDLINKIKVSKIVKEEFRSFEPEEYIMNCGMKAKIIAYRRSDNIDVEFEDGTIVRHRRLDSFRKRCIAHPNISQYEIIKKRANCVGKTVLQKCGKACTCVAYRKADDIDLEFEDGAIVTNKRKKHFLEGSIGYPLNNSHKK